MAISRRTRSEGSTVSRRGWRNTSRRSRRSLTNQTTPVEELLGSLFDGAREGLRQSLSAEEYEKRRHDFAFHLTDIREDVLRLAELLTQPTKHDEEAASADIIGILYHVIPHLNAAGRLLLDQIHDPFAAK
jgi:hypothetical protein